MSGLPVAVIGAGPQGLAAGAHLLERGLEPLVFEAGDGPGAAVAAWGHVRLFSAWPELVDPAAARLLAPTGWTAPAGGYPTGAEWISAYLAPLAAGLGDRVRYGTRVIGVSRQGRDRLVSADRDGAPFMIHTVDARGVETRHTVRAVIDASGTWRQPNPAGADGLPALGERAAVAAGVLSYLPPTPAQVAALAGGHVVVVGSGHSAMTAVIDLAAVAREVPGTRISWVLRRGTVGDAFGGGAADALPARGALGVRSHQAVDDGLVDLVAGFRVERVDLRDGRVVLLAEDGRSLPPADRVVAVTGFRPDLSFLSEMRLDLDPILQAPVRLAGEIDPNVHSCGTVMPHGARELAHPEKGLYLVGMKSYGRAPTFLAMTGYEQVRSVVAALAGDHQAAARVELTLPNTGVCSGGGLADDPAGAEGGGGCCAPPVEVLSIGRAPASA
ncbi:MULTISPECIES: NAD(P)-binding domain-containing protein [unclassified Frankia]|uniref:NAD(P)-binding domain-containing protein n=2 Tax=Frankia TaxID=1854 RepID=UPI001932A99E|nr:MULTISPECIES: NAD(P)-binding domain-containing protein [unclassified Frankia]MBL7491525.1 NAD(P)-binding domain-containing protein [Frankia sp. AgW1.1]MBL7622113.1 NAD(P)-binding domain-containing protein [Frankia sp. AgB1.8]